MQIHAGSSAFQNYRKKFANNGRTVCIISIKLISYFTACHFHAQSAPDFPCSVLKYTLNTHAKDPLCP